MKDLERRDIFFFLATLKVKCNTKFSAWSFKGNQNEIYKCQTNMKPRTTMNMAVKEKNE
jgi:hypothetical protein